MERNRILIIIAVSLITIVAVLIYFPHSGTSNSLNANEHPNEAAIASNDGKNELKLNSRQQSSEAIKDIDEDKKPVQTISQGNNDGLKLPALPYNSEYDVLEGLDIAAAMERWEKFRYTKIKDAATISEIADKLNIKTKTEVNEEQIQKCRTKLKTFLTMYSGKSGSNLLKLHNILDPSREYNLQDEYIKDKMELANRGLQGFGVNSNEIPANYQDRWIKFASMLYEKMGPSVTDIAVDESHLVINRLTKDKYDPKEWDPRNSNASSLNRIYTLLSSPQGSANAVLSSGSFLEKCKRHKMFFILM